METTQVLLADDSDFREAVEKAEKLSELNVLFDAEATGLNAFLDCPLDFAEIEDVPTATGELRVRVKRGRRLIDLLAALRTGDLDGSHAQESTRNG